MAADKTAQKRRRWALMLTAAGIAAGAVVWQAGQRPLALAQEWMGAQPIGEFYSHEPAEFPHEHLGDVTEHEALPRSLGDTRVRQYDELDRPRFNERWTHRGVQINEERFSVMCSTGDEDARLAAAEFGKAWDEFGRLADTFTSAHRNPDFGIGQLLIVINDEPLREQYEPQRTLLIQDGQTIVYLNVADGQPGVEERLGDLRQGAVHALLHLAELDRKFPLWAQQGLAEYTADKIEQAEQAIAAREHAEDEEGFDPQAVPLDVDEVPPEDNGQLAADMDDDEQDEEGFAAAPPVGAEYWRLQRSAPDRLAESFGEEEEEATSALERVKFLLEGNDSAHAPEFLIGLRELAQEATDPLLASRAQLSQTQLLAPAEETIVDELFYELEDDFVAWQADPLRGQPLFVPGGDIPDSAMLAREREMEVVLKLALRQEQTTSETEIRPRITEFGAEGARDISSTHLLGAAINVEQLYHRLADSDEPWATLDADGQLLLWTDHEELSETLGIEENRYSTEYRDGHWVLVATWDEGTQLEAWLEPNENNPSRPLVKFAARQRQSQVRVAELPDDGRLR